MKDLEILPYYDETNLLQDDRALQSLPRVLAERLNVFPISLEGRALRVAVENPRDLLLLDEVSRATRLKVLPVQVPGEVIGRAIRRHYPNDGKDPLNGSRSAEVESEAGPSELVAPAPAVATVDQILRAAIEQRASDVHMEPQPGHLAVRLRVDGVLYDHVTLPVEMHPAIISRLKIMANMDIAEKRLPQDGRFEGTFFGQAFDVRVSTLPGMLGEAMVLRILPKSGCALRMGDLGLSPEQLRDLKELICRPFGMLLTTGPTGSGKTTTLYACLSQVERSSKKVITIEEPVEYQLPLVTQIQIRPKIGLTFANGLRHMLRHDPDVIMVGEIRDVDTLNISIQAALTGHLVFSTLHCNDAAAAPARLMDMGEEPYLVASSLMAVLSQRLVRKICPGCKQEYRPPVELLRRLKIDPEQIFFQGRGCHQCRGTGYLGRTSVFEIMRLEDQLRAAIVRKEPAGILREIARSLGVSSMLTEGIRKAKQGITSLEEVVRAVYVED